MATNWARSIGVSSAILLMLGFSQVARHATDAEAQTTPRPRVVRQDQTLTATAAGEWLASIPVGSASVLVIDIYEHGAGNDPQPTVRIANARAAAILAALEKVGVPASNVRLSSARVTNLTIPGQGVLVSESLETDVPDPEKRAAAFRAAMEAGAKSVRTEFRGGASAAQIDTVKMTQAVMWATEQAKRAAQAAAQTAGLTLVGIRSIDVQSPQVSSIQGVTMWRVYVTVVYAIR